jgi:hypothetical protein
VNRFVSLFFSELIAAIRHRCYLASSLSPPETTLKTWTVMETILGVVGFIVVFVISFFV